MVSGNLELLEGLLMEHRQTRLTILNESVSRLWSAIGKNDLKHLPEPERKQILGEW